MHQVHLADTLIVVAHLLIGLMIALAFLRISIMMLRAHLAGTLTPLAHLRTGTLTDLLVHYREMIGWIKPGKSSR